VKKTPLEAFSRPKRGGIRAIELDDEDRLIGVRVTSGDDKVVLGSEGGMSICFHEKDLRAMGRTASGNRGIRLRKGDFARDLVLVDESKTLLTVCEMGYGKRTPFEEYRLQRRGGIGILNIKTGERNGPVIGMKSVGEKDELLMVTTQGMMVRITVESVRQTLRNAKGVRLISLTEGDKLVSIARLAKEDVEEAEVVDEAAGAAPAAAAAGASPETRCAGDFSDSAAPEDEAEAEDSGEDEDEGEEGDEGEPDDSEESEDGGEEAAGEEQ
jgi:DNA gyrase subunit A